ncbi:MAG: hypothetical protein Q8N93_10685, partial [Bacillota bacterium]|nr:hypothetical protein [Bacillota bacterium]
TRVRDLIDLVLIRSFGRTEATRLIDAIQRTFTTRATHPIPQRVTPPPPAWRTAFVAEADRVGISPRLDEAHDLVATWLDPVLSGTATNGWWNPEAGHWEPP